MVPIRLHELAVVIGLCSNLGAAQDVPPSLYIRSLTACVQAKQVASGESGEIIVLSNVIVNDPAYFYPPPSNVGSTRLEYLDTKALEKRFRQTGRPFRAIEIKPMVNSRALLIV